MKMVLCSGTDCVERLEAEIYWAETQDYRMHEFLMKCPDCGKINTVYPKASIDFETGDVLDWEEFFGITLEESLTDDGLVMEMANSMYHSQPALKDAPLINTSYDLISAYQSHAEMALEILNAED